VAAALLNNTADPDSISPAADEAIDQFRDLAAGVGNPAADPLRSGPSADGAGVVTPLPSVPSAAGPVEVGTVPPAHARTPSPLWVVAATGPSAALVPPAASAGWSALPGAAPSFGGTDADPTDSLPAQDTTPRALDMVFAELERDGDFSAEGVLGVIED
jgi:hypothetical protein